MFRYTRLQYVQAGYAILTMSMGIFFMLIGTLKLSPVLNDKAYRDMRKLFIRHAHVFPLASVTGFAPNPHLFRQVIGVVEFFCGVALAVIPGPVKDKACIVLMLILAGALHGHYTLNDSLERASPALTFVCLLCTRMLLNIGLRSPFFLKHFCQVDISQFKSEEEFSDDRCESKESQLKTAAGCAQSCKKDN